MQHDPSSTDVSLYECYECGARVESDGVCPECAGEVRNLTVPRN
ncbi:rubrerythrin-like domain-containing protein [Halosegnis sp.]